MKRWLMLFLASLIGTSGLWAQRDTLIVGVYQSPPFVIYEDDGSLSGVSVWLWEEIEKDLNLPFKIHKYPEAHSLRDIMEDLEAGRIDLSINPLTVTVEREARMDFTHPFYIGNLTVAKNASSGLHSASTFFREFFTPRLLWLIGLLVGMVVFFGLLIWLIERKNRHFDRNIHGLLTSFWWSAVTMTTVGYGDKVPVSHLGRFVAFLWMLCSVIIISVFTASITSGLTVRRMANTDLSEESFIRAKVGTVEASASEEYLGRNFYRNLTPYPDLRDGLKGLARGEVEYFIYDEPWLIYQLNNNPEFAEMELLPVRFNLELYAMALNPQVAAQLKDRISVLVIRIQETRDWDRLLSEYQLEEL